MSIPNTPANGEQILTWQERMDTCGRRECESLAIELMQAEIDDLRASLASRAEARPVRTLDGLRKNIGNAAYIEHYFYAVWRIVDDLSAALDVAAPAPVSGMPDLSPEECTLCNGMGMLDGSGAICPHCNGDGKEPVAAALPAAPAPTDSLISILEEISVTDLAYKQRDLATKALDILTAPAPTEQQDELPITRSTYGSLEACEAEQARRNAASTEQAGDLLTRDAIDGINWLNDSMPLSDDVPQPIAGTIALLETFARLGMTAKSDGKPTPNSFLCLRFAAELRALAARQAPLPTDFLMPEDAWNEYATRSGLLNEHGVAPHPVTAQAAYFAYQAAWNCLHKAFSAYIAARQAPTVPKLDYDLLKLALEQSQERLSQAEEAIAKRDATALRVAQCAGEFARDAAQFATAIALEDNAETLYSVVMSHAPDTAAIRRAFDAAIKESA